MHPLLKCFLGAGAVGIALNEIRGAVLAVPVLIALWQSGGTAMAIWVALCSLAGIALSVIIPWWGMRKLSDHLTKSSEGEF